MSDGVLICLLTHIIGVHSATDTSWCFVPDEDCDREWGYFPVKGHTGSHIPLGRVVPHLICAVIWLSVKLVMYGLTYLQ